MRIEAVPLGLALLAMLAGCVQPTPYQPAVDGYDYSEQQIEDNRFWVRFAGNDRTPAGTVQNYWLYRVAELTLDHGYDHFIIIDRKLDRSTTYEGTTQIDPPFISEDGQYISGGSAAIPPHRATAIQPTPTWSCSRARSLPLTLMPTTRGACCVGWGRPSRRRRGWRGAPPHSRTRSNKKHSNSN